MQPPLPVSKTSFRIVPMLLGTSSKIWWLLLPAALTALAFADRRLWLAAVSAGVFALRGLVEIVEVSTRLRTRTESV